MEGLGFSKSARRTFHDQPYLLTVKGAEESLGIEVEHAEDGRRWHAQFSSRFIEEITQRTGNVKKFDVFVRMLLSALAQESEAVYLDVLTARDLEMLRRHTNPHGPPSTSTSGQSDKRYVILTYRGEFDKVHYPLPLPLEARSEEEMLRAMVSRLRGELSEAHQLVASLEQRLQNGPSGREDEKLVKLQRQNAELQEALLQSRREADQLRTELRHKPLAVANSGGSDVAELNRLKGELARVKVEGKSMKDELRQREVAHRQEVETVARELRAEKQKVERLQSQLQKSRVTGARPTSAERTRAATRSPSGERARPPSRPPSRPLSASLARSRASSVASSRERTPSPSSFLDRGRAANPTANGYASRPPRSDSPGQQRDRRPPAPTSSPYSRPVAPVAARRTSSPTRGRERTPSPGSRQPVELGQRPTPALTLRDRERPPSADKPISSRYTRPLSASRAGAAPELQRQSSDFGRQGHQPGSLFGLAANLGLGLGPPVERPERGREEADSASIDARLQALQSFLRQTKNISS